MTDTVDTLPLTPHLFIMAYDTAGYHVEFARWCNSPAAVVRDDAGEVVDVMRLDVANDRQDIKLETQEATK